MLLSLFFLGSILFLPVDIHQSPITSSIGTHNLTLSMIFDVVPSQRIGEIDRFRTIGAFHSFWLSVDSKEVPFRRKSGCKVLEAYQAFAFLL